MYFLPLFSYLSLILGVLISVAFIILVERKVLGYIQLRKGPNKLGYLGIIQSFSDAIKLFIKEQMLPSYSNLLLFYLRPLSCFFVILITWILFPTGVNYLNNILGGVLFFCLTSFGVYTLLGSGWRSNSNYALLGAIRGVAQTISYEVSMALLFLCLIFMLNFYNLKLFSVNQGWQWLFFISSPIFIIWFSSSLAETNRTPFDFAEGESELVSGFNVEYGRGGFALLFLAEYARIIFISYLMVLMFLGGVKDNLLVLNFKRVLICFTFIWVRGTLPRFRYDKLIYIAWKVYLPLSLLFLLLYIVMGVTL